MFFKETEQYGFKRAKVGCLANKCIIHKIQIRSFFEKYRPTKWGSTIYLDFLFFFHKDYIFICAFVLNEKQRMALSFDKATRKHY